MKLFLKTKRQPQYESLEIIDFMLSATINFVSAQSKPSVFTYIDANGKNYQFS